jgi:hypothetical protein
MFKFPLMIWNYIKADAFFRDYLPEIKSYKHKIRGKNGRGNPTEFTKEENKAIRTAIKKMLKDAKL